MRRQFIQSIVILMQLSFLNVTAQDLINQYANLPSPVSSDFEINLSSTSNTQLLKWYRPFSNPFPSYDGEYNILTIDDWLFWENYIQAPGYGIAVSYQIEVVSFPFLPDCIKNTSGCGANNPNPGRNFILPSDPYDPNTDSWDYVRRYIPPTKFNVKGSSLASFAYAVDNPVLSTPVRNYFPHTILKHTLNIHCETNSTSDPITPPIFKFSWLHDNTRGRMKSYPFCPNSDALCNESQYDVCFAPRLLHKNTSHYYNESSPTLIVPVSGTLDYFKYSDLVNSNCNLPYTIYPLSNYAFYNYTPGFPSYIRAYFAPYSLITAPLYQSEGRAIAGYEVSGSNFSPMFGISHNYTINSNFDFAFTELATTDRIFYNPSDVTITATDLHFPSHYSFRTIRGVYPSPAEVANDNTPANGGFYSDDRDVPVRTDLRSEDPLFPDDPMIPDHSRYASLYRLAAGSKLTFDPCVEVFDAAFILNPGSVLEFANAPTFVGLHRVAIDRMGGRLIRKYDLASLTNGTLFLQDDVESANSPNTYVADAKIHVGEFVDPNQTAGPYVADIGSNLELIAKEYIKLDNGFSALPGSAVKITIDPNLSVAICPPPLSGGSGNRIRNSTTPEISSNAHIKLLPNPFQVATGIYIENKEGDEIQSIVVMDATGKTIKTLSQINTNYSEISLAEFNDGLYFIIVKTIQNQKVFKALKQG
ncbi:MAG: T9SS type A sorting domain-containing protein [Bacteroidetes bacterium]|nr:T9SS type A sorting domain-containing protein [Bacteroidota bacterium]